LHWYVVSFSKLTGIKVTAEFAPRLRRLPKIVELSLFRIVQEAMINIQRHSQSRAAHVRVGLNDDAATLQIKDRGIGIPKNAPEGLGIRGIRERVLLLKGELEIVSNRRGTTLTVTIPIPQPGSPDRKEEIQVVGKQRKASAARRHATRLQAQRSVRSRRVSDLTANGSFNF
jgi:signal transduction histidine kinase